MKAGDKVWVFDGYEIKQVCIEGIEPSLNGKAYVAFGGFSGRLRLADPLLCFPTREALCEHYRKIFE